MSGPLNPTNRDDMAHTFSAALRACHLIRYQCSPGPRDSLSLDLTTCVAYSIMSACIYIDHEVLLECVIVLKPHIHMLRQGCRCDTRLAVPRISGVHPAMHYVWSALQIPLVAAICTGDEDTFEIGHRHSAIPETTLLEVEKPVYSTCSSPSDDDAGPPSSAHVFYRWQPWAREKVCGIPILCMARVQDLRVAMSAVLHQRHTWGLPHSMVGIQYSPSSPAISFVIGWYQKKPKRRSICESSLLDAEVYLILDVKSVSHKYICASLDSK